MAGSPIKKARRERWEAWSARPEAIDEFCEYLASGKGVYTWALENKFAYTVVVKWINADATRRDRVAQAREQQADVLAEEIITISDDSRNDTQIDEKGNVVVNHDHIARAKLRVDSRKWYASKLRPRTYGDKIQQEHSGTLTIEEALKQLPD